MKKVGAWMWVLVAGLLFVAAAPLTSQAAGSTDFASKPKPDAGK